LAVSFFYTIFVSKKEQQLKTNTDMAENFIIKTALGFFIIEDCGDKDYDVATNIADSDHYYHIPKGLSKSEIQRHFLEIAELEE
jgi:hypothetical protein